MSTRVCTEAALRDASSDEHAPPPTRVLPERPPPFWHSDEIRHTKHDRRKAELAARKSGLEIHKLTVQQKYIFFKKAISAAKTKDMRHLEILMKNIP